MEILRHIYKYIKNFYVLSLVIFLLVMLLFAEADFFIHNSLYKQKEKLLVAKEWYKKKIDSLQQFSDFEKKDSLLIEQYAREVYLMKKTTEDLYLIVEE